MYTIRKDKNKQYVIINNNHKRFMTCYTRFVNKLDQEYRDFLIENMNGFYLEHKYIKGLCFDIYFKTLQDAREAKKWLEALEVFLQIK